MKAITMVTLAVVALAFVACSDTTTPTPTPKTVDVEMVDNAFNPKDVTINVGDTVKWTNNGVRQHSATSGTNGTPDGKFNSGLLNPGGKFSHTFDTAGTFPYYCQIHWQMGMTGTVKVVQP